MIDGKTATVDGQAVGEYQKTDGSVGYVSLRCTHMGCTVKWNESAKTWDCPCHGSRFQADGKVIQGPAQRNLLPVAPPQS